MQYIPGLKLRMGMEHDHEDPIPPDPPIPPEPPFPVAELPGLLGWFDGGDASTIQVDGSNQFLGWTDKSPNGLEGIVSDVPAPFLVPDVLAGKSLLKLSGQTYFQTIKDPLPFGEGWAYSGPMVSVYVGRMKVTADFDGVNFLSADGAGVILSVYQIQEYAVSLMGAGYAPQAPALNQVPNYLASSWPGRIYAPPGGYVDFILINSKGDTGSKAQLFWKIPAAGAVPAYFSTIDVTPVTHTLSSNGSRRFFFGEGSVAPELYPAEWFISTATPQELETAGGFDSLRNTLIAKWFGTLRPFVLCLGDSLTGGFGIGQSNAYPYLLGLIQATKDFANVGINGRGVGQLGDDWPAYASLKRPGIDNWVNLWAITNDIAGGASNADNCLIAARFLVEQIQADGWKVRFIDCIPRNFGAPFAGNPQDPVKEAIRIEFNARIEEVGADAYVHLTASAPYNDPNAWMSTEFYMDDQVHQNAAGNARTAQLIAAAS